MCMPVFYSQCKVDTTFYITVKFIYWFQIIKQLKYTYCYLMRCLPHYYTYILNFTPVFIFIVWPGHLFSVPVKWNITERRIGGDKSHSPKYHLRTCASASRNESGQTGITYTCPVKTNHTACRKETPTNAPKDLGDGERKLRMGE